MATSPVVRGPEQRRLREAATATAQGQCSRATAQQLTDELRRSLETSWQLLREAFERRAWAALGHESWDAYCAAELSTSQLKLSRERRQQIVAELTGGDKPLSNRAVATALGVDHKTVAADRAAQVGNSPHLPEPQPEIIDAEIVDVEIVEDTTAPEQEKVTGADGKIYPARQQQTKTRRRPLPDAWKDALYNLEKVSDRVLRLAEDDRFPAHADALRKPSYADLSRVQASIDKTVDAIGDPQTKALIAEAMQEADDIAERRLAELQLAIPQPPKRGPRRQHLQVLEAINTALGGIAIAAAEITELDNTVTPVNAGKLMADLTNAMEAINQIKRQLQQRLNDQTERTDK